MRSEKELDEGLRPLFERLRQAEAACAPPFRHVLDRRPGRPRLVATRALRRRLSLVSSALALFVVVAWWVVPARVRAPRVAEADMALLYWRSPTQALLTSQADCMSDAYADAVAALGRGKVEGQ